MPEFSSPSTGTAVKAVLFDTFGTVVDWRSGIADAVSSFAQRHRLVLDPEAFADAWRAEYQPSMEPVRSGARGFVSLDVLHRENLLAALKRLNIAPEDYPADELDSLARAWHFLPPWADSVSGLKRIKRDYVIGPLSNGNTSLLLDLARTAGLPWDLIIGSDLLQAYKPQREAYLRASSVMGCEPGEVMLAAAHNNDLLAARSCGLATAFITRPTEHGPGQSTDLEPSTKWDLSVQNLNELAAALSC